MTDKAQEGEAKERKDVEDRVAEAEARNDEVRAALKDSIKAQDKTVKADK